MSYISLYRKYRPKSFKDVVGQQYVVKILKNSIVNNQIANAYVFAGTKGTGKTTIAKIFANAMNCLDNKDGDVCGQCEICKDYLNNQSIDLVELDGASNNGVNEVRQIADAAIFLPSKAKKKVYIIDEAHMLTNQAWNALLKLIEEPPVHVVFIFATTEMHKIPDTILSRCQCFRFNKISSQEMFDLLVKVCKKEEISFEQNALRLIVNIADGSARDALSILEQIASYSNKSIKSDDIYKIYGLLSPVQMNEFINLLLSNNNKAIFAKINEYLQSGINFSNFVNLLVSILTDKLIYLKTNDLSLLSKSSESIVSNIRLDDVDKLVKLIDIWQETYFKLSVPTDTNVVIVNSIIKSLLVLHENNVQPKKEQIIAKQETPTLTKVVKEVKTVAKPITNAKIETSKTSSDFFTFWDVKIEDKPKKVSKTETKKEEKVDSIPTIQAKFPEMKDLILSIFSNKEKIFYDQATQILQNIKTGKINEKSFSILSNATQVLCASPNGIIFLYGDEVDAKLLNNIVKDQEFILTCCKYFRCPKFVVGCTKEQINSQKEQMLNARKHKKPLLNVEILRTILNGKPSIEQIAFNTIYSNIDLKDRK